MIERSTIPDLVKRWFFYVYSAALFLPACYRLYLPSPLGDYLFYGVAYLTPVVFAIGMILFSNLDRKVLAALLTVTGLIIASWILTSTDLGGVTALLYGFKIYLVPILMFIMGYAIAGSIERKPFIRLLVGVMVIQLVFSLVYYFNVLDNPMYRVLSGRFSENWVVTAGDLKAFIGLTLSKFDLAYQIGFLLIGLIFSRAYLKMNTAIYYTCIALGMLLVIFTYNKTIMAILILAIAVNSYRLTRRRARIAAYLWIVAIAAVIGFFAISFLTNQVSFAETFKFLTPQTFWSRVFGWYEAFHYDPSCLVRGYGAGYLDMQEIILDSQYLYTYLELGLIGAIAYFWLFAYTLYQYSTRDIFARTFIALIFLIFVGGDTLGAVAVTYICGLYFGQFKRLLDSPYYTNRAHENSR